MEFVEIARLNEPLTKFVFEYGMTVGELAEKAGITLSDKEVIETDEGDTVTASDEVAPSMVYSITKNYKNGSY